MKTQLSSLFLIILLIIAVCSPVSAQNSCDADLTIDAEFFYNAWQYQQSDDEAVQISGAITELSNKDDAMCVINGEAYIELLRSNLHDVRLRYIRSNKPNASGKFVLTSKTSNEELLIDPQFMKFILVEKYYCYGLPISSTRYHTCKYCGRQYMTTDFYYEGFNNGQYQVPEVRHTIVINARGCPHSQTGNCNDLLLQPLTECGDPVGCEGKISRNSKK
jgi:hypothetical protein